MNHDENKPEIQTWIEPELEARIVAWVAGEASAFESAELERLVSEKPELAIFKRRIEAVHGLVAVAARPDREPLHLSPERRAKLLQTLLAADGASAAGPVSKKADALAVFPLPGSRQARARRFRRAGSIAAALMLGFFFSTLIRYSVPKHAQRSVMLADDYLHRRDSREYEKRSESEAYARKKSEMEMLESAKREGSEKRRMPRMEAEARKQAEEESAQRRIEYRPRTPSDSARFAGEPPAAPPATFGLQPQRSFGYTDAPAARPETLDLEKQEARSAGNAGRLSESSPDRGGVVLSPFEVKSDGGNAGYASASTLAGSRVTAAPSDLKDQIAASAKDLSAALAGEGVGLGGESGKDEVASAENPVTWARKVGRGVPAEPNSTPLPWDGSPYPQSPDSARETVAGLAQAFGPVTAGAGGEFASRTDSQPHAQNEESVVSSLGDANKENVATDALEIVKPSESPVLTVQAPPPAEQKLKGMIESDAPVALAKKPIASAPKPASILAEPDLTAEVSAAHQPVSTFSLHVSDVSFRLAQAVLLRGQLPEADRIRPEEFYNAFNYGDPSPTMAEKVACHLEQSAHPLFQQRNLVRIAMRVPAVGRGASQPLRLTVMLDTSGSMEREDRAATVHQALASLASLLGPNDRLTVIGFARQPHLLIDQLPGNRASEALTALARTPAEGGTDLEAALKLASELALRHHQDAAQNRIVLLTDGAANLGNADPEQLASSIEALRQQGVAFDACGVGLEGIDDTMLEALTRKGDGRYYVLNTPEAADAGFARQLAGAFRPAAENVKVQVRFNSARVGAYRLIGFEKHRLKEEDFRNDKVDAAELAADEAAVAVYQVETLPQGEGDLGEVYVRFRDASNGNMVERSWPMSYNPQVPAFDRAPATMQLAGVATLLAEKLRGGRLGEAIRLEELAPVVNALRGHYAHEPRVQQLVTMYEQLRRIKSE